jgi:hypothetical protein
MKTKNLSTEDVPLRNDQRLFSKHKENETKESLKLEERKNTGMGKMAINIPGNPLLMRLLSHGMTFLLLL